MLEWINAILDLFAGFCLFLLNAPFYGDVTVGYLLIAIAVISIIINFILVRVK